MPNDNQSNQNQPNKQKTPNAAPDSEHERKKRGLKRIGAILLAVGGVCALVGFIDFFSSVNDGNMPTKFFLLMLGLPCLGFGAMLLVWGNQREIQRYMKNEGVPVINEAAYELKPAVRAVKEALAENGQSATEPEKTVCPACGEENDGDHNFCSACGKPLFPPCPVCGKRVEPDEKFCPYCGAKKQN